MARRSRRKSKAQHMSEETKEQEQSEVTDEQLEGQEQDFEDMDTEEVAEDMEQKFVEMNDKFLRLYSEFENFRRRTAKEKLDLMTNAEGESMKTMIPILDDFERAIANNDDAEDVEALRDGFKLIYQKLNSILSQKGVTVMDVEAGSDFDTDLHEAITQIPAPSPKLKGKVVDVVEKGYMINEKVLRYAKVVVGS